MKPQTVRGSRQAFALHRPPDMKTKRFMPRRDRPESRPLVDEHDHAGAVTHPEHEHEHGGLWRMLVRHVRCKPTPSGGRP
jgi:hypothetical protein